MLVTRIGTFLALLLAADSLLLLLAGVVAAGSSAQGGEPQAAAGSVPFYIGTYTRGKSKGIYLARLDRATGKLSAPELAGETVNPSFVAIRPDRKYLYAAGEISQFAGAKSGAVSAFAIDASTGKLTLLNQQASRGTGPCHVNVDRSGKWVLVANYGSGSAACMPIEEGGRLGEATSTVQHEGSSADEKRQKGPHAHSINLDAANRFAFVADLGLDKVMIYRFDAAQGKLTPNDPAFAAVKPGSGPRHFAFHPNGRFAYVINEMASAVTAFAYDAQRGALTPLQTISTLPEGFAGNNSTAEVQVHPSGKFLYGSNRGHNSIAAFAIDESGKLRLLGHESTQGKTPRNFGIDPSGAFLIAANQDSDNVVLLRIDLETGKLQPTGSSIEVGAPVCIKFLPQ